MVINIDFDKRQIMIDGKVFQENVSRETIVDFFEKDLGAKEWDSTVEKIQKWYYGRYVKDAWCCTSLSYYSELAGKQNQTGKHENCDRMKDFMQKLSRVYKTKRYGGDGKYTPKRGDVVFMSSKKIFEDITHVGVVSKINGNMITVISGNMNDKIQYNTYNMSTTDYIIAYGKVD